MSDTRALDGIRILDFTQVLAGPFATQQLAQLGADVVKIEARESGDMTRGFLSNRANGMAPSFLTCNLGKRSITLDLKHERAKEIVFKLIETSDAVVENFKPGTIERLGFGYEAVKAVKPNIVYASISGYGQSGPKSRLPAFDGAIQADSGMMSVSGHPETGPVRTGYFAVDMSTALNAAFAITGALFRQHRTGEGQRLDIAMMDTAMMMLAPQVSNHMINDVTPELLGNASPTRQPTANVFATADGFVQLSGLNDKHARLILALTGLQSLFEAHPKLADRVQANEQITQALKQVLSNQTTQHWLDVFKQAGVPAAPIRGLAEVSSDEQSQSRLSFVETTRPDLQGNPQSVRVVNASHMSTPAPPEVQRPPPTLGEHTNEILEELGYDTESIAALRKQAVV